MRKWLLSLFAAVLSLSLCAQEPYPALGARLDEYLAALSGESPEVQNAECDFLIESARDSLLQQYIALKLYDHYLQSKIMGEDAVAVHVAKKWFLSGTIPMHSEGDLMNARLFVTFNQSSLIGCQAPELSLFDASGATVKVPEAGKYTVLYFYDTSCSTCKVETVRLKAFVAADAYPVQVCAVYVGASEEAWKAYREAFPGVTHLWDPEISSDWQLLYGVLQTPRMFLVGPSGTIVGRGLDTPALQLLLKKEFSQQAYTYGEASVMERYRQFFVPYGDSLSVAGVMEVADYLAARSAGSSAYKQVMGDFLYFLSSQKTEVFREAALPFVEKYIRGGEVWTTPADEAQVLSLGEMLVELASRTPVGSLVPDLRVQGTLRRAPCLFVRGTRSGMFRLRELRGSPAYLVFYTGGCSSCRETLAAVDALVASDRRVRVLLIDMDALFTDYPDQAGLLLDHFDLSALPMVVELDRNGRVRHRYVEL